MQPETQTSAETLKTFTFLFTFEFSRFGIHCPSLADVQGLGECGCNGSLKRRLLHFRASFLYPHSPDVCIFNSTMTRGVGVPLETPLARGYI